MEITENTLQVVVPRGRSVRLQACETFKQVTGDSLNDVDVLWQNEGDDRLWLVELKDYGELIPEDPDKSYLKENLTDKVRDTLYVLASVWAGSDFGFQLREDIQGQFPDFPDRPDEIRPVAILNLEESYAQLISSLMTDLNTNSKLRSVLSVMDITRLLVVGPDHPFVEDQLQIEVRSDIERDESD
jgi:hypothetical protein